MSNFEKKFGKYAIPNLTLVLILFYVVGYLMQFINSDFLTYLTLDPYKILHGQVWRVISWLLIPPSESNIIFVALMLFCCYSIGTALERTWGTYRYNLFIFTGVVLTVLASFLGLAVCYMVYEPEVIAALETLDQFAWGQYSTYFINMSIYIVFAMTYPNNTVRFMFIIPMKMKWLGIVDVGFMVYYMIVGGTFTKFAVGAALINCLIFFLLNIKRVNLNPKQVIRKQKFQHEIRKPSAAAAGHKCSICGQTDTTNPNLEFRFCSKCKGSYEYCSEHLFTHEHKQ